MHPETIAQFAGIAARIREPKTAGGNRVFRCVTARAAHVERKSLSNNKNYTCGRRLEVEFRSRSHAELSLGCLEENQAVQIDVEI
jgi:hypothetical protein